MKHKSPRLKRNSFDLLRLIFAGMVCLAHSYELSGLQGLEWIGRSISSAIAVKSFFVVSGFLIFMSYERSSSLTSYMEKRIRRIYPAYFAVVTLCAIGLAAASTLSLADYFSYSWLKYLAANLSFMNFLHPTLPGVFESNRMTAVNGALWTLKIEMMFYLTVPLFGYLMRRFSRPVVLALVYASSVLYAALMTAAAERTGSHLFLELSRQLPGQLSYFIAGAFLYYYLPLFERYVAYFLAAAVAILIIDRAFALPILEPFALAVLVVFAGLFIYLGNTGKYGDFSYGVYILHYPLIQLLVSAGWFQSSPWAFLGVSMASTMVAAMAMWHLVEKRFLLRSSHYIASASAEAPSSGSPDGSRKLPAAAELKYGTGDAGAR